MERKIELNVANQDFEPEIFNTIQGEGRFIGTPATFVRLSGCNLQCTWCDTPYTWNFENTDYLHDDNVKYDKDIEQSRITADSIVEKVKAYPTKFVVFSGGEPMLQQNQLLAVLHELPDYFIEVETNGTIKPTEVFEDFVDHFNVSPKLSSSGNDIEKAIRNPALEHFARLDYADFKFVIKDEFDLQEALELVDAYEIPAERVYLMPEGRVVNDVEVGTMWLADICKEYQFNLTTRLHVLIWGEKRGV